MRAVVSLVARLVPAVLILVVAILSGGAQLSIWPKDPTRDFAVLVVAAALAFSQSVADAITSFRRAALHTKEHGLDKVAIGLLRTISDEAGVSVFDLAVSVFEVGAVRRRNVRRVHRTRLNSLPYSGDVKWKRGKGLVGQVVASGKLDHLDWRPAVKYGKRKTLDDEAFGKVPEKYRSTFTMAEFRSLADRYSELLAVPIVSPSGNGKVIGVVSVDLVEGVTLPGVGGLLDTPPVREAAAHAAEIVSQFWSPKQ